MNAFFPGDGQVYFVYGSNMNPRQLADRGVRAEVLALARLNGYRLGFFGHSKTWDGAEETVEPQAGGAVWGVVCRFSYRDADCLDVWQDVRLDGSGACFHCPAEVQDADGVRYPTLLYKKDVCGEPRLPSAEYVAHLVAGAEARGLPSDYVAGLRQVPSRPAGYPVPKKSRFDRSLLVGVACDGCC